MLKKRITFEDYDGNTRTEEFNFNITQAEMQRYYFEHSNAGMLEMLRDIMQKKDVKGMMDFIAEIIALSYGVKSEDGKRFIKTPQLTREFTQTEAYSQLYMELLTKENTFGEFIKGCLPKSMSINAPHISKNDVTKYLYGNASLDEIVKTDASNLSLTEA